MQMEAREEADKAHLGVSAVEREGGGEMRTFFVVWVSLGIGFVLGTIWTGFFNATKEAGEVQADVVNNKTGRYG